MRTARMVTVCATCAIAVWAAADVRPIVTALVPQEHGGVSTFWLLYIGPDLLLPFTSAIGAAIGVVLMFWQRLRGWARRVWHSMVRRKD